MTISILTIPDEPWMVDAACRHEDPELFFDTSGTNRRRAKAVCARCPVARQCLRFALEHTGLRGGTKPNQSDHGIYGGTTPWERDRAQIRGTGPTPATSPTGPSA